MMTFWLPNVDESFFVIRTKGWRHEGVILGFDSTTPRAAFRLAQRQCYSSIEHKECNPMILTGSEDRDIPALRP